MRLCFQKKDMAYYQNNGKSQMIYMYIKNEYVEKLIIFVEILLMLGVNDVVCIK